MKLGLFYGMPLLGPAIGPLIGGALGNVSVSRPSALLCLTNTRLSDGGARCTFLQLLRV